MTREADPLAPKDNGSPKGAVGFVDARHAARGLLGPCLPRLLAKEGSKRRRNRAKTTPFSRDRRLRFVAERVLQQKVAVELAHALFETLLHRFRRHQAAQ